MPCRIRQRSSKLVLLSGGSEISYDRLTVQTICALIILLINVVAKPVYAYLLLKQLVFFSVCRCETLVINCNYETKRPLYSVLQIC